MTNIYDLIDQEDIDNLQKLIFEDSHLLEFAEDDRDLPSETESAAALDQREKDPLKYAIMHKKEESVACILRHNRYKLMNGDLSFKADEILTFSLKNLLQRVFGLHSMNADFESCKKDIQQSKRILKKLIFHFVDDVHKLYQSEIIFFDNNNSLSKISLPLGKHLEFLFTKKIYGFQPLHLVMLLGDQEAASCIIQKIPAAYLSILEEGIFVDCAFYGYNSLHLAAILNLDKCMRSIAIKLNNQSQLKKLLESRPSDLSEDGENYTPLLLASRANSVASFLVCLELGANIYSTGIYIMPLEDGNEEIIYTDVLSDALCAVSAADDDRMLQAIITYLKQRPLSEFYEFINNPEYNCLASLIIAKRSDLANIMINLSVKFQNDDFSERCKSFEHNGITIYNANILHMAVLLEDKDLVNNILTYDKRESINALLNDVCFYGLDLGLNPLKLIILKYFLKQNLKESALEKMAYFESYQEFLDDIKMPLAALEILDMLLMADVSTHYQCLIKRKKSLALQVMNDTIHSLFLNLHAHNIFNINDGLILKLVRSVYLALGFNYNGLFEINSVTSHFGKEGELEQTEASNDLEIMSSTTVFFCSKQTPPYKIAMLAFRSWRQNQPLRQEETLARDYYHCRNLVDLIASVLKQKWHSINPLFQQQPRLFIQLFSQQISMINLSKSEIEKVFNDTCLKISNLKLDSEIMPTWNAEESKEEEFILRLARDVLSYFDEECATFRFWNRDKEKDDLIDRIYDVAIKYLPQLRQLSTFLSRRKKLIADLAMSNFAKMEIERIIKAALDEAPVVVEKRPHQQSENEHELSLLPPNASKRTKTG